MNRRVLKAKHQQIVSRLQDCVTREHMTARDAETDEQADEQIDEHLRELADGAGCTEIWEHLSKRREQQQ